MYLSPQPCKYYFKSIMAYPTHLRNDQIFIIEDFFSSYFFDSSVEENNFPSESLAVKMGERNNGVGVGFGSML